MGITIALLRGINVGGKHVVKMAELRKLLEGMGLRQVSTYIQSGNVLFETDEDLTGLQKRLTQRLEEAFGFPIPVVLRTLEQWDELMKHCPFRAEDIAAAEAVNEGESLYAAFLRDEPSSEDVQLLEPWVDAHSSYRWRGREIYLLFSHSIRDSKLASHLHKVDSSATVRNWKTISKLRELAHAYRTIHGE